MPSPKAKSIDWTAIGNLICTILEKIRDNEERFTKEAAQRGVSIDQFIAATVAGAIRQRIEPTH